MAYKTDTTNIKLPEPLYNFLNFIPKNIRERVSPKIIPAYTDTDIETVSKLCQQAADAMLLLHVSQADIFILNRLAFRLSVSGINVEIKENPDKEYTPFESDSEYRDAPKIITAKELCVEVEEAIEPVSVEQTVHRKENGGDDGEAQIEKPKPKILDNQITL